MTNEPLAEGTPGPEGEELVEADLPTTSDPTPPAPRQAPAPADPAPEAIPRSDVPGQGLADALLKYVEEHSAPVEGDLDGSVIDELGDHLVPQEDADRGLEGHPAARAEPDPTNDGEEELVEADLPTTGSPRPDPPGSPAAGETADDPFERIDRAVEEWGETLDEEARARRAARLESYREEYGDDAEAVLRHDEQQEAARQSAGLWRMVPSSSAGRVLTLVLAGMGVAVAIVAATAILGGSDDSSAVELAAGAASVVPTVAATAAATAAATLPAQTLANPDWGPITIAGFEAAADGNGDLWILLDLVSPWGEDPPAVEFVYAALIGAGVVLDGRITGSLYSITEGASYAESVVDSPDFPRSSNQLDIRQADLWVTDEGALAIHLAGNTETGGLDAALVSPDTTLVTLNTIQSEAGVPDFAERLEQAIGEILPGEGYPFATWSEVQPDAEPLRLDVPDTSNDY